MEKGSVVMKRRTIQIVALSAVGIVLLGLAIANEIHRYVVIAQNKPIAVRAQHDLDELIRLGFSERDICVQSAREQACAANHLIDLAQHKWWMISVKTKEHKSKVAKLKRLIKLNNKILKSYKQDLTDLRKFGFPENDVRVVFSRNKIAQTVVELAHLTREYKRVVSKQDVMTNEQIAMLQRMINLNKREIGAYTDEIDAYLAHGLDINSKKIKAIRSKMAAKIAENSLLERKLYR